MMFGMNKIERLSQPEAIRSPEYRFTKQGTLIFITGVPLSGKSTIAPLVVSSIEGCTLQPMDIIRLVAQEIESHKPESERNKFVNYGSCDGYVAVGDGSYSPQSLILGFNAYSEVVCSPLRNIIPKLEVQGAQNVLFEGVQLTPSIVIPYLNGNSRLIIVTSDAHKLESNRRKMFGDNTELIERYSTDRLLLLQREIIRQSEQIPQDKSFCVDNTGDFRYTTAQILQFMCKTGIIEPAPR
jgi:2-phosphoglycerate kinase